MYKNLKALRESLQMTQEEFGKSIGIAKSTYNNYEIGEREPKSTFWISVAQKYNVSIDYLMGYTDDPHSSQYKKPQKESTVLNFYTVDEQSLINKYRALDIFGQDTVKAVLNCEHSRCLSQKEMNDLLSDYNIIYLPSPIQPASAGTGEFADDESVERVPVLRNVWTSKADYALRVHGDSMEPDMHDGDMLLVRSQPAVEIGEIGIFIHQGERFVKVFRGDYLESLNDEYDDIAIEEDTKCIGKVFGVLKPEWIAK